MHSSLSIRFQSTFGIEIYLVRLNVGVGLTTWGYLKIQSLHGGTMAFLFFVLGLTMLILGMELGGAVHLFIDYPSLTIVLGITCFFTFAHHTAGGTVAAFKAALSNQALTVEEMQRHERVLSTMRTLASAAGVLGSLIGFVNMLANLDDPKNIGPAMAVAMLTLFYGVIIAELCIGPLISRMKLRSGTDDGAKKPIKPTVVTFVAVPVGLASFGVLWLAF